MSVEAIEALAPAPRADNAEQVTALVRAIRTAMGTPKLRYRSPYRERFGPLEALPTDNLVAFHVSDIYEFARRLVEQGVRPE
jgi:hypothetical protein